MSLILEAGYRTLLDSIAQDSFTRDKYNQDKINFNYPSQIISYLYK